MLDHSPWRHLKWIQSLVSIENWFVVIDVIPLCASAAKRIICVMTIGNRSWILERINIDFIITKSVWYRAPCIIPSFLLVGDVSRRFFVGTYERWSSCRSKSWNWVTSCRIFCISLFTCSWMRWRQWREQSCSIFIVIVTQHERTWLCCRLLLVLLTLQGCSLCMNRLNWLLLCLVR